MVVFFCSSCNDSLKKSAVESHLIRCRCDSVSCCDCGKDFTGNSYKSHTECVSEDVKYGPQDQAGSTTPMDKGKRKQKEWLESIKEAAEKANLSGPAEMALNKLLEFPNIPRKKSKFINFAEHCCNVNKDVVEQIWNIFDTAIRATASVKSGSKSDGEQTQDNEAAQKTVSSEKRPSHKLKRKLDSSEPEVEKMAEPGQNGEDNKDFDTQEKENDADQSNESSLKPKKSKKKKKRQREEEEEEERGDQNIDNNQDNQDQKKEENVQPETSDKEQTDGTNPEEKSNIIGDEQRMKKKKKKKSKVIPEIVSEENKVTNSNEQAAVSSSNEHESEKEEKMEHIESNNEDVKSMESDENQTNLESDKSLIASEETIVGQQIGWFKKLKRQIKESETVDQKKFKKTIKRLKKEYSLTESHSDLCAKARAKLMKRHNYTITDGEITYKRLF